MPPWRAGLDGFGGSELLDGRGQLSDEPLPGLGVDSVQRQVRVEIFEFDEEKIAGCGTAGVDALDSVLEIIPIDEVLREGQIGSAGFVGVESPAFPDWEHRARTGISGR